MQDRDDSSPPNFLSDELKEFTENFGQTASDPALAYEMIMDGWGKLLAPLAKAGRDKIDPNDRRFSGEEWEHPVFDLMRQSYSVMSEYIMDAAHSVEGLSEQKKEKLKFAAQLFVDALSPANSPLTNPAAIKKAFETNGESLKKGMEHLSHDLQQGQITHTQPDAFILGENIAVTPGKVVHEERLFQLIQYAPSTKQVAKLPLIIFPPWINRFYILDLTAKSSFVKWCVESGITVFIASWKSADESMADVIWDDYIQAQISAIDIVRDTLGVPSVNTIGYCVAGTTLAATLSILEATGRADTVESVTFFTAQVDFAEGGELLNFIDDNYLKMIETLSGDGYLDGRYLSLTFNILRSNGLIWSNVQKNYLLGEEYPAFDLLHWNGDVTNLPAKWHGQYLRDIYRDNLLVEPGRLSALDTPIDLTIVKTPTFIQAGREDHIAPAQSVWKLKDHFSGPVEFLLAGSGHIAGVVNPPEKKKYQYWLNDDSNVTTLDEFIDGAAETNGSWWPHWREWYNNHSGGMVDATGARIPGKGKLKALEDAPGSYVKSR